MHTITAQHDLVLSALPLTRALARRMYRGMVALQVNCELDDARQEAALGAILAARKYTPDRGPFSSFAYQYVRGALLNLARRSGLVKVPWRLLAEKRAEYARVIRNDDERFDPPSPEPKQLTQSAAIATWLRRLTKRELLAVGLRYGLDGGEPMSLRETGEQLGCPVETAMHEASYLVRCAMKKLREQIRG